MLRIGLDELVGGPGDGVGFAGPGRMLDQTGLSHPVLRRVAHQFAHHIHLVVPGEKQGPLVQRIFGFAVQPHKML